MDPETRNCQSCKAAFTINAEDFAFYERLQVPPPTWCPPCRFQRKCVWRNERTFYKRPCNLCDQDIIALYPKDAPFPVYCRDCWWSDNWDPLKYGSEYDGSRNFFDQYRELLQRVPRPALIYSNNVNSHYVNYCMDLKNCYFVVGSSEGENCTYCTRTFKSKESVDNFGLVDSELCLQTNQCTKCYKTTFTDYSENALESVLLNNCKDVQQCVGCVNLRNKTCAVLNRPCGKEEYAEIRKKLGSYAEFQKMAAAAKELALGLPHRYSRILLSSHSDGDELTETKNCHASFFLRNCEGVKYTYILVNGKDVYDCLNGDNVELIYESANLEKNYHEMFSLISWFSNFIAYCDHCFSSSNLFGCIGLRNQEFCILNKKYEKEDYEALRDRIIADLQKSPYVDSKGRTYAYGEFFPPELSPFAYNETVAHEYVPLTEEAVVAAGYRWKRPEGRDYKIEIAAADLPDHIDQAKDDICSKVIGCADGGQCLHQCATAFKILPEELQLYRTLNMPLPRLCPNCRHHGRLARRNPMKTWKRTCHCTGDHSEKGKYANTAGHFHGKDPCPNEFETTTAPERPEIVYCEACYQQEVA